MADLHLQEVREWFTKNNLSEYAEVFISNGFDSIELILECVDKTLLEGQFSQQICLPGKRHQLMLAIKRQKDGKSLDFSKEKVVFDWFKENEIGSYFDDFVSKGYDELEVIIETITEEILEKEFSIEIPLLGQRKKVALAVRKAKQRAHLTTSGSVTTSKERTVNSFLKWTDKALGINEPWKKLSLGYIPYPKGERSLAYMKLLPVFYEAVWPYCQAENVFRKLFMEERSRQYGTSTKISSISKKIEFMKGENPAACGRYLKESYIAKSHDTRVLSQHISKLIESKAEVIKMKDDLATIDQSLFEKKGMLVKRSKVPHHNYNLSAIAQLNELQKDISELVVQLEEKYQVFTNAFRGLVKKAPVSHARKRKQNKQKADKRKRARSEKQLMAVMQKIAPSVVFFEKVDTQDIIIEEVKSLKKRESQVLYNAVNSGFVNSITEEAKKIIADLLPGELHVTPDYEDDSSEDSEDDSSKES